MIENVLAIKRIFKTIVGVLLMCFMLWAIETKLELEKLKRACPQSRVLKRRAKPYRHEDDIFIEIDTNKKAGADSSTKGVTFHK